MSEVIGKKIVILGLKRINDAIAKMEKGDLDVL
jgi:hypothetical protein